MNHDNWLNYMILIVFVFDLHIIPSVIIFCDVKLYVVIAFDLRSRVNTNGCKYCEAREYQYLDCALEI